MTGQDGPQYRTHTNEERIVRCPCCDKELKSRGLYQHVWRSGDEAHGGHKELPEDWDDIEPDVVDEAEVSVHVPTSKEYDQERVVCRHCGQRYKGTHGLSVHLSRTDNESHPEDADVESAAIHPEEFSDEPILNVGSSDEEEERSRGAPDGYVPVADVVEVIARLESRGHEEAADDLRAALQPYR